MPLYEHVFLARQDVSAQQVEGMKDARTLGWPTGSVETPVRPPAAVRHLTA